MRRTIETIVAGVTAVAAVVGFAAMIWISVSSTFLYLASLDPRSPSDAAILAASAFLFAAALYFVFYPEGQKCPPTGAAVMKKGDTLHIKKGE